MDCKQMREVMDLYVDRELSMEAATAASAHLAECRGCRRIYEQLLRMRNTVKKTVASHNPPEQLVETIRRRIGLRSRAPNLFSQPRRLARRAFMRAAVLFLGVFLAIVLIGLSSATLRSVFADTLERVALDIDRSNPVVLEGKLICRDCELHERYGAPVICPRRGHHGVLKTRDGKIWNFIEEDSSEALIHDSSLLGRGVRIQGRMYREADAIWVDKYELL